MKQQSEKKLKITFANPSKNSARKEENKKKKQLQNFFVTRKRKNRFNTSERKKYHNGRQKAKSNRRIEIDRVRELNTYIVTVIDLSMAASNKSDTDSDCLHQRLTFEFNVFKEVT